MPRFHTKLLLIAFSICCLSIEAFGQEEPDFIRQMQFESIESDVATWGFWGDRPAKFSSWTNHSNRLIPIYTWGVGLESVGGANSVYRNEEGLTKLYGQLPKATLNPAAEYFDQTDVYRLQKQLLKEGRKHVFVFVFDGMDWPTTQAAAIYKSRKIYRSGRGSGLHFLDYKTDVSGYGAFVSSPHNSDTKVDVNSQTLTSPGGEKRGGYHSELGGSAPWAQPASLSYLIGKQAGDVRHAYTDSAASATSLFSGVKTYNASINVSPEGKQVRPISHDFQAAGYKIGIVSSVPISHATPACGYASNVTRNDYQDLTRDMLGLRSISHRQGGLPGVDVLIGGGWGELKEDDREKQGNNFEKGNKYLAPSDREKLIANGKHILVERAATRSGAKLLKDASDEAVAEGKRLFGFFGGKGGHLPYRTADGDYNPTRGESGADRYKPSDIYENPTLADMAGAAINVLKENDKGFWLTIESGDVDWANHNNNIDDSIGAVISGDEAFKVITDWVETNSDWNESAVILTADHGHLLVLRDLERLVAPLPKSETKKEHVDGSEEKKKTKPESSEKANSKSR